MTTTATLMTTRPSVEPGTDLSSGVGVGVGVPAEARGGREVARTAGLGVATCDACADPEEEGDKPRANARTVASTRSGNNTRSGALSILEVSISWASRRNCIV
jgi:hypothetical protein